MSDGKLLPERFALNGQVTLVTGASRGIGRAIADDLAAAGAIVVGTATSAEGADSITARFAERGWSGRGVVLDVADRTACAAVVADIAATEGAVTVLVNNAGITRDNLTLRMKDADWDAVLQTNLTSAYQLARLCLRGMMKAQSGRIINIGSVIGVMGNAGQANYAAAKAGMIGFSKSLAKEVGSRNITVNVIAPGFIQTDMTDHLDDRQRDVLLAQVPLNRLGRPEDVSSAVLFLASAAGSYITGATLHINGGLYTV